jgi:hypothetical protein
MNERAEAGNRPDFIAKSRSRKSLATTWRSRMPNRTASGLSVTAGSGDEEVKGVTKVV